jgi:hypothetical protein
LEKDDGKLDVSAQLYQLALIMANGKASSDSLKLEWVENRIKRHYFETKRQSHATNRNATGSLELPGYYYKTDKDKFDEDLLQFMAELFKSDSDIFTYTWKPIVTLPSYFGAMTCLKEINLAWNRLTHLPATFFHLPFLRQVFLNNNQLTTLPAISGCPLLEVLDVHKNRLASLPPDLHFLPVLTSLNLESNRLRSIPVLISDCRRLSYLDVSNNLISYVPPEFSKLSNLSNFRLECNPISNLRESIYRQGTIKILQHLMEQYTSSGAHIATNLIQDFSKFEKSDLYTDIAFKPRGAPKSILAHRIMIAARCPKLHSYVLKLEMGLSDGLNGKSKPIPSKDSAGRSIIPLNDIDPATFDLLKIWIYTDQFNPVLPTISKLAPNHTFEAEKAQQQEIAQATRILGKVQRVCEMFNLTTLLALVETKLGMESSQIRPTFNTTYATCFKTFLNRSTLSDVVFLVEGQRIYAHKFIICARSDFFKAMFETNMMESSSGEVTLPDTSPSTLHSILAFCYRDEAIISPDIAIDLLLASKRYTLPRLGEMVETVVSYSLDNDNVASVHDVAKLYGYNGLKEACENYIIANWSQLKQSELPVELVKLLNLKVTIHS